MRQIRRIASLILVFAMLATSFVFADAAAIVSPAANSIVYTDWIIHSVIRTLREIPDRRGCVLFVSDHGESLGENDLYMHGVPMAMAPKEQLEIPYVVWTSDPGLRVKDLAEVGQYSVYHTVLRFLGIQTPVYDPQLDIFE